VFYAYHTQTADGGWVCNSNIQTAFTTATANSPGWSCGPPLETAAYQSPYPALVVIDLDCDKTTGNGPGTYRERHISYSVLDQFGRPLFDSGPYALREVLTPINGSPAPSGTSESGGKYYGKWISGQFTDIQLLQPGTDVQSYRQSFDVLFKGQVFSSVSIRTYNSAPVSSQLLEKTRTNISVNGNSVAPDGRCR
jgi:hypothetical protein